MLLLNVQYSRMTGVGRDRNGKPFLILTPQEVMEEMAAVKTRITLTRGKRQ